MNKVFNRIRMAAAVAALAGGVGFGAMEIAKYRIDPNDYRQRITGEIARASGIQAGFERLEWLPYRPGVAAIRPALRKNGVEISARRLEAVVSLPSLLFGPPRLSRLSIDGLVLTAERDAAGRWNTAQLFTSGGKGGEAAAMPETIELANASVTVSDDYAPRHAPAFDELRQTIFDRRPAEYYFGVGSGAPGPARQLTPAAVFDPVRLYLPVAESEAEQGGNEPPPKVLTLRGMDMHLHIGGWLLPTSIKFKAELFDPELAKHPVYRHLQPGRVALSLKTRMGEPDWDWNSAITKGTILVDSVYSGSFDAYMAGLLPAHYSRKVYTLDFTFNGRLAEKLAFNGSLAARPVEQAVNPALAAAFAHEARRFNITGAILPDTISLDRIELFLPDARLDARLEITNYRAPDPAISFRADTSFVEIEKLNHLVPPAYLNDPAMRAIRRSAVGGRFKVSNLSFKGPYSAFRRIAEPENMDRIAGRLEVVDGSFIIEGMKHPVKGIKGVIDIKGNLLTFENLSAIHGRGAITKLGGSITGLRTAPYLKATLAADVDIAELRDDALAHIASKKLGGLIEPVRNITGAVHAIVNVQGDILEQRLTELDASLLFTNVGFSHERFKVPVSGLNGALHVTPTVIEIKDAAFNVEASAITVKGAIRRYAEPGYDMELQIDVAGGIPRMAESPLPLFDERLQEGLTGNVIGSLALSGTVENLAFHNELNLTQANVKLLGLLEKRPGHVLTVAATGTLAGGNSLSIKEGRIDIDKSHLHFHGTAPNLESWAGYAFEVDADMLDLGDGSAYVKDFKEGGVAGRITGQVTVADGGDGPAAAGGLNVKIDHFDLAQLENLKEELPLFGYLKLEGKIAGDVSVRFAPDQLPNFNGWVSGEEIGFFTILPHKFLNLRGRAELKGNMIGFKDIPFTSGNSSAEASGSILISKDPIFKLDVKAEKLDLADVVWLEGAPDPWWSEDPSFYTYLIIKARSKSGALASIPYSGLDLDMRFYRDQFTFKTLRFGAYQGTCEATGDLNMEPIKALFTTKLKVTGIELESLMKDIWPAMDKVTGKLSAEGSFSGEGLAWKDLRHTLNGTMKFDAADGLLAQFAGIADIFSVINVAPLFEKRGVRQKGSGLPFDNVTGTMAIKNGIGHTDDLVMEGGVMRMSAAGDFRFNDGTVKLLVGVKPFTSVDSIISSIPVAGALLTGDQKSLIVSYYRMTGPMDDPVAAAVPGESVARTILGIFQRALETPAKALSSEKELEKRKTRNAGKNPGGN